MRTVKLLAGFLMAFFFSGQLFAAIAPNTFSAGVVSGGYFLEKKEHLNDAPLFGIKMGYDFTKKFGLEVAGDKVRTKPGSGYGEDKRDLMVPRIDSLYYLLPDGSFVPFFSVGIGGRTLDVSGGDSGPNHFLTDIGLGVKYFLNKHFALRGDVRYMHLFNETLGNYEATLGLFYKFGSKRKTQLRTSNDSDQDGIPDDKDLCANTPNGVKVGSRGCPEDSDNDGVPDFLDKCPATPIGARIDREGCPEMDFSSEHKNVAPLFTTPPGGVIEKALMEKGRVILEIRFDNNDTAIKPAFHAQLAKLADIMKQYPQMHITIEGHTDNTGAAPYNLKLSQERAENVAHYLAGTFGIDRDRLNAKGYGQNKPIAENATEAGRLKNRRVEAVADHAVPQD